MSVSIEKIINSWQVTKYDLHILTLSFKVPLFIIFLKKFMVIETKRQNNVVSELRVSLILVVD